MLTDYDVTKFATYQWRIEKEIEQGFEKGFKQGFEKGFKQGFKKGKKTGEQKGKLKLAQQLLQQGIVDDKTIAQILNVPVESLNHLVKTD